MRASSMSSSPLAEPKPRRIETAVVILDASATLALILKEPGAAMVVDALRVGASMSAVNVAEVAARLQMEGWSESETGMVFDELCIHIRPFDADTALLSGRYRISTQALGLGLGDRACLATACMTGFPALTADRAWIQLDLEGVEVRCIR